MANFPPKSLLVLFIILLPLLNIPLLTHSSIITPNPTTTTCSSSNTTFSESSLLLKAFSSVSNFSPSLLLLNKSSSNCYSSITQLLLPSKNLSGTISWKYLKKLTNLRTIDLSNNSLQGNIPIWFYTFLNPNLHRLNISNNDFGGSIGFNSHHRPNSSSPNLASSSIQVLDASNNRFSKLLGVSGFVNLTYLDVSGNDLRKIPEGGFSGLGGGKVEVLRMKRCNVSGGLNDISGLSGLRVLDLSENRLEGEFPDDFPSLDGLGFLNVSFNRFRFSGDSNIVMNKYQDKFGRSAFIKAGNFSTTATSKSNNTSHTHSYHSYHAASSPHPPPPPLPPTTHHPDPIHHHHQNNTSKTTSLQKQNQKQNQNHHERNKRRRKKLIKLISIGTSAFLFSTLLLLTLLCYRRNRRQKTKWAISKPLNHHTFPFPSPSNIPNPSSISFFSSSRPLTQKSLLHGPFSFETESGSSWVADLKEPTTAPVVMFEKPLVNYITFKDLIVGTCGFGKESQLGEGNCGIVYRAVLPGDLHVAVKVLEYLDGFRGCDKEDAVGVFEDLGLFRHPNLLPISGYCIAGKEKLILNEFMPNGDLHNWLHELPPGKPNVDDWSMDTWDYHSNPTADTNNLDDDHHSLNLSPEKLSFRTRHRIAVGIARGLAYLHHARSKPLIHGHLIPSNILLTDDLEPRISDFGLAKYSRSGSIGSTEDDVYCFGLILIELFTGKEVDEDGVVCWVRRLVKNGNVDQAIDPRLMTNGGAWASHMAECLRVGYLCTAEVPGKRPTMQQVVGLLKDVNITTAD